jgi:hypothetical protein
MIHGVYIRTKPKHKWYLFSVTLSAEAATRQLQQAVKEAQKGDNIEGEAAIQVYNSPLFIPELLSEIKEQKAFGFN